LIADCRTRIARCALIPFLMLTQWSFYLLNLNIEKINFCSRKRAAADSKPGYDLNISSYKINRRCHTKIVKIYAY
jgi:hypothetical protein